MTDEDIRDLHFLLEFDSKLGKTQWRLLIRYLRKVMTKAMRRMLRK